MNLSELRAAALNPSLPAANTAVDPLPHDLQAESWVLGNISKRPALLDTIDLAEGDFYVLRNRHAFRAMRTLHASGEPWHFWRLAELMAESFTREEVPLSHRDALIHVTGYDWDRPFWETPGIAGRLRECGERRRLIAAAQRIAEAAWDVARPFDVRRAAAFLPDAAEPSVPLWEAYRR